MWTIKKERFYVKAQSGQKTPYTTDLAKAVRYKTYEEAKKNACGNESVIKI